MRRPLRALRIAPVRVARWSVELVATAPGLIEAHLPGAGVDARTRERLILAVAEANGATLLGRAHRAWWDFLGPGVDPERVEALVAYARSSAETGEPLDPTTLRARFAPPVVRAARATVSRAELQCLLAPLALPDVVAGAVLGLARRLAPAVPEPVLAGGGDANLVAHLLAGSLPVLLGHTVVRTVLLWNPLVVGIGVRAAPGAGGAGTAATVRVGRGRVEIVDGVRAGALVVVDGGLDPLLRVATGAVIAELARRPSGTRSGP